MTLQVTEADKRFTDITGRIYAGMTTEDAKKENVESVFTKADDDKNGVLSYEEMFNDLKKDYETCKSLKKQGFRIGIIAVLTGILTKKHAICLGCAGFGLFELIYSKIKMDKMDKKHAEWTNLYSKMETTQA